MTLIAINHVKLLDSTIENIVWQKTKIFKSKNLAFSTFQLSEVITVLQKKTKKKQIMLKFVDIDSTLSDFAISLKSKVQLQNCLFAFAVVRAWLWAKTFETQNIMTSDDFKRGFENFFLPGRFQKIMKQKFQWFFDRAHNELNVPHVVKWFVEAFSEHQK